jgi:hypothetical protein
MCLYLFSLNFPASVLGLLYASLVQWVYTVIVGGLFSVTIVLMSLYKKQRQRIIKVVELLTIIYTFYYAVNANLFVNVRSGIAVISFLLVQLAITYGFYHYFSKVVDNDTVEGWVKWGVDKAVSRQNKK